MSHSVTLNNAGRLINSGSMHQFNRTINKRLTSRKDSTKIGKVHQAVE